MGQVGREIVRLNVEDLLEELNTAYANEWKAHFSWWTAARLASGLAAEPVVNILKKSAMDELGHADRLARRILELGGSPTADFGELVKAATAPSFMMPETTSDMRAVIEGVLEFERAAIHEYQRLADLTRENDPVTFKMVQDILSDEVREEEEWENLIR